MQIADLIGIPYKAGGRDARGLDCYGLALEVYRRLGVKLRDATQGDCAALLSSEKESTLNIRKTDTLQTGTLLVLDAAAKNIAFSGMERTHSLETSKSAPFLHIGVALNAREFIHATKAQGVRISAIKNFCIKSMYEVI